MSNSGRQGTPLVTRLARRTSLPERISLTHSQRLVLAHLDQPTSVENLALMSGLDEPEVQAILDGFQSEKLIEWVEIRRQMSMVPPGTSAPSIPMVTPGVSTPSISMIPEEDTSDLDKEQRSAIEQAFAKLAGSNHYEMLGVPRNATKEQIRDAYFSLSRIFHPDAYYGKRMGLYLNKMEAVFNALTQAYNELSRKKSREDYDAYLNRHQQLQHDHAAITDVLGPVTTSAPPPFPQSAPPRQGVPSTVRSPDSLPSADKIRRRAAQRIQRTMTVPPPARSMVPPINTASVDPPPRASQRRLHIMRGLATSLKNTGYITGGRDKVASIVENARKAEASGNWVEAMNSLRLACDLDPQSKDLTQDYKRVRAKALEGLAVEYQKQAQYEERNGKWRAAAASWEKVLEGRPSDLVAHRKAATAYLNDKNLRRAQEIAQKACELNPKDAESRLILGKVFLEAGLKLNARKAFETARELEPTNPTIRDLLKQTKD